MKSDILRAVQAAEKKIRTIGDKKLNENLEWACGTLADAYRIGLEEAQREIVARLVAIQRGTARR